MVHGCGPGRAAGASFVFHTQGTHVVVEVDLDRVPFGGDVPSGDGPTVSIDLTLHHRGLRKTVTAVQVVGDQLGLAFGDRHDGPQRLDQTHKVQSWDLGVEDPLVEPDLVAAGRIEKIRGKERETDFVAGAKDHQVGLDPAAVGENDLVAVEVVDVGFWADHPVCQPVQDAARHRGVCLGELVVGAGQPVTLHRSGRGRHDTAGQGPADPTRDPFVAGDLVVGTSPHVLGDHVHTATCRQVGGLGVVGGIDRDVHTGVAHPDHDHTFAGQLCFLDVGVGVHQFAGEGLRTGKHRLGKPWVPMVAVGHQDRVVPSGLSGGEGDLEGSVGVGLDVGDSCAEPDAVCEPEMVDVVGEVLCDLVVAGKFGQMVGHREVTELHPPAGGVDV